MTPLHPLLDLYESKKKSKLPAIENCRSLLNEAPRCFDRNYFSPGHFTGSAFILDPPCKRVLLVKHKKLKQWLQPGGHADGNSDLIQTALRELSEEAGVDNRWYERPSSIFDIDIHEIPPYGDEPQHLHFDIRVLLVSKEQFQPKSSDESTEVRWFTLKDAETVVQDSRLCNLLKDLSEHLGE